ncbi:hypothetical protein GH714_028226 [Hevea brasiliensis]|uniref:Protein kinase domain-containing protein n=1 Tax=Hevea brasiliensis TaxID=3981 RepID=A0A6A6LPQ5_HEVBR|nr:hypothetical protein GH714_028226 [Hevea brasiliensis]
MSAVTDFKGLGNCSSLSILAIVGSNLTGNIPSSFGLLDKLSLLYLTENRLSGRIPPELGKCKSLTELKLYRNQLEGEIPIELGMLSELQNLELFENRLNGEIPISIWKIQSLRHVLLYKNNLSGELPLELTHLKRLEGSIPSDVGKCPTLWRTRLDPNNLSGVLPEFLDNPNLAYMNIKGNNISGKIPSSLGNCTNLTSIDLSMNGLEVLYLQSLSSASGTSISVSGTLGYIAPENAYMTARGKESDVYYGVVLLELITRRKPSDSSFMEEVDIVGWVRSLWSETQDITAIVDSSLMEETVDSNVAEQIIGVLLIALRCTEKEPSSRPTMRDVVKQLLDVNPPQRKRYSMV